MLNATMPFESIEYKSRHAAVLAAMRKAGVHSGTLLFLGTRESPINYGANCYPYRQDSTLLYMTGISTPSMAFTINVENEKCFLYFSEAGPEDFIWTGETESMDDWAVALGVTAIKKMHQLHSDLPDAAKVHYLPPWQSDMLLDLAHYLGRSQDWINSHASEPLIKAIVDAREVKSATEVAQIECAVDATIDIHKAAIAFATNMVTEQQVCSKIVAMAALAGFCTSFAPIATQRPEILHPAPRAISLVDKRLFLIDAGVEVRSGYAADLSTTFAVRSRFDGHMRDIYSLVLAMHNTATAMLAPGISFFDIHQAAAKTAIIGLIQLGLMQANPDEALEQGAHGLFFPHGLGHLLGLDAHDMEHLGEDAVGYRTRKRSCQFGLANLRFAGTLREGMVLTIEPGLYFIPTLISAWKAQGKHKSFVCYLELEKWLGMGGVRNEEDWLVTQGGARRLGKPFPKDIESIEALATGQ